MQLKFQIIATVLYNSNIDLLGVNPVLHHATMNGLVSMLLAGRSTSIDCVNFIVRNAQLSELTIYKRILITILFLSCFSTTVNVVFTIPTVVSLVMRHHCCNY